MAETARESVWVALFNLLQTVAPPPGGAWNTIGRNLVQWDSVPAASQPAFFLHQGPETGSQAETFLLTKWTLKATVWIYYRTNGLDLDQSTPRSTLMNQVKDNFEKVIDPHPGQRQTLGGLVYHCWIDGTMVHDDGLSDNQAVLLIPLTISMGI